DFLVHFGEKLFPGHAGPPLLDGFEFDDGLEHGERRGVGGGFGFAGLAEDRLDLWELAKQAVLDLEDSGGFADGDTGHGSGHEQKVAFIEWRHELLAELFEWINGDGYDSQGDD